MIIDSVYSTAIHLISGIIFSLTTFNPSEDFAITFSCYSLLNGYDFEGGAHFVKISSHMITIEQGCD